MECCRAEFNINIILDTPDACSFLAGLQIGCSTYDFLLSIMSYGCAMILRVNFMYHYTFIHLQPININYNILLVTLFSSFLFKVVFKRHIKTIKCCWVYFMLLYSCCTIATTAYYILMDDYIIVISYNNSYPY